MAAAVLLILTVALAVVLVRVLRGPKVLNRILAGNAFGTVTVLWLAAFAFVSGRHDVVDIAMLYGLISFVGTVALLKFAERRDLGADPQRPEDRS